jgi:methylmalonyl-CoA/ethylmalonyl-CoA epimerase
MTVKKIHHINFLVKNLQQGIERYRQLLGIDNFIVDELPGRGVITARALLGEQWLVLVQPVDSEGTPAKHLAKHGEGFFLIAYLVDDLNQAANKVQQGGSQMTTSESRQGLENWQVWDIDSEDTFGTQIQLCEEQ